MTEISVYLNRSDWSANKRCLCRRVEHCESLSFPYDELKKSLKFLFGSDSIIEIVTM